MNIGQPSRDWEGLMAILPTELHDVYFSHAYHALHADEGQAMAFTFARGPHRLLVPGLRVAIPSTTAYDLQTPNGYGGPLVSPDAPDDFVAEGWHRWKEEAAATSIVAGFFRLHPVLKNRRWLPEGAKVLLDRKTVYVDLSRGLEAAWQATQPRRRTMVNRGRREGTPVRWNDPDDWHGFEELYANAMARLNAPDRLRFDTTYFAGLRAIPGTELACTGDDRGIVAGLIFLWGPVWGHYHLGARRDDAPDHAMGLLMQSGFERAHARGLQGVHLGGGASTASGDGVLRFKQSFSGIELDFDVGLVVADDARFGQLVEDWTRREGRSPSWLLGYRQPSFKRDA